jgi:hypothetical protein
MALTPSLIKQTRNFMLVAFGCLVFIGGLGLFIGSVRPIMLYGPRPSAIFFLFGLAFSLMVIGGLILYFST